MSVITNQPLVRHPFNIHNGSMVTSASLPQYHTEGYAEGVGFNYGFIQNPDTDTATNKYWHPLKGNIIEYWHVPSEGISCVELNATDNSSGIKQKLMAHDTEDNIVNQHQFAQGFYLITWKDRGRRGDSTNPTVNNSYNVKVTFGDPSSSSTVIVEKSIAQNEIVEGEWRTRYLLVQIKKNDEFNTGGKDIWLSMDSNDDGTFGTLITDVRVCPIALSDEYFSYISPNEAVPNVYSTAWIKPSVGEDGEPAMPNLKLVVENLDLNEFSVQAKLHVTYQRPEIKGASSSQATINAAVIEKDTLNFPVNGSMYSLPDGNWHIAASSDWCEAVNEGFFGGTSVLTIVIYQGDTMICNLEYPFRIAGLNPDDSVCEEFVINYIRTEYPTTLGTMGWVMPAIGKSESKGYGGEITSLHPFIWNDSRKVLFNQFVEGGGNYSRVIGKEGNPLHSADNSGAGGYGIFQVTGDTSGTDVAIPRAQIWNWQENVKAAMRIIKSKYDIASSWMNRQIQQQTQEAPSKSLPPYRAANSNPESGLAYDVTVAQDTEKTMTHLCTIKAYNGASKPLSIVSESPTKYRDTDNFVYDALYGHYCTWRNDTQDWCISRYNSHRFDYVERVLSCRELPNRN